MSGRRGPATRTNEAVIAILLELYEAEFGGKRNQRYTIDREDIRRIYGFARLFDSRVNELIQAASQVGLLVIDLGQGPTGGKLAVVKTKTVSSWRAVTKRLTDAHAFDATDPEGPDESDEDE